ncbi:MAG TPA: Ig-like domain-containing protein [Gemmatimonadales bacterium]
MRSPTTEFFLRIPGARWAPLFLAAGIAACSSNNSGTGGTPVHLTLVTGASINATVGTVIGPIEVRVTDADTLPVQGVSVTFAATGGATFSVTTAATDDQGQVLTTLTLPHTAGTVTVTATAAGIATPISFQDVALADVPSTMNGSGNNQTGAKGTLLGEPIGVAVADQFGNPVAGVTIAWTTTGGTLSLASSRTNASGAAQTQLTLPDVAGPVMVTGSALLGSTTKTVNFTATAN